MVNELPENLPPLPEGAVYLGRGGSFSVTENFDGWFFIGSEWAWLNLSGIARSAHYAAPAGSEIARLNGHGKPSWTDAPEWAQWRAQDYDGKWRWHEAIPPLWQKTLERRPQAEDARPTPERMTDHMGGPAFPNTVTVEPSGDRHFPNDYGIGGIEVWDYYAAAALAGILASTAGGDWALIAEASANQADAMMEKRAKRKETGND